MQITLCAFASKKRKVMKRIYLKPEIELIKLDNEISLQLSSTEDLDPMGEPNWSKASEYFNNDPYKNVG
jgi:hypothetical protein